MAENNFKDLKRAVENIGAVRTEFYLVKRWQAGCILGMAALMIVGLFLQFVTDNLVAHTVGYCLVLGGAVVILGVYLVLRLRGPMNYTTYFFRVRQGDEVRLQVIGRTKMFFEGHGKVIGYDRRSISRKESLYRDDVPWNWFEGVTFTDVKMTPRDRQFLGEKGGRRAMLSLKSGVIDYAEASGMRMRYFEVNNIKNKVERPADFYDAIMKLGFTGTDIPFIVAAKK